jgi:hypothetical protein
MVRAKSKLTPMQGKKQSHVLRINADAGVREKDLEVLKDYKYEVVFGQSSNLFERAKSGSYARRVWMRVIQGATPGLADHLPRQFAFFKGPQCKPALWAKQQNFVSPDLFRRPAAGVKWIKST